MWLRVPKHDPNFFFIRNWSDKMAMVRLIDRSSEFVVHRLAHHPRLQTNVAIPFDIRFPSWLQQSRQPPNNRTRSIYQQFLQPCSLSLVELKRSSSILTPRAAVDGSKACSASIKAAMPPFFSVLTAWRATVYQDDSGP